LRVPSLETGRRVAKYFTGSFIHEHETRRKNKKNGRQKHTTAGIR
jgi:hypothetical protein